ncbi:MAG: WD40 repeat domain-containing protein [Pigmentiphaga sp.]
MKILSHRDFGEPCLHVGFLNGVACVLTVDGRLSVLQGDVWSERSLQGGDILAVCPEPASSGAGLLTASEDGRVLRVAPDGVITCLAQRPQGWITALAAGPGGQFAYGSSRTAWWRRRSGDERELSQVRPVEALAFSRDGGTLAIGLYDGLLLQSERNEDPLELPWKGVPTRIAFAPDDRFVLLACRDAVLHGWRRDTGRHFRMVGYSRPITDWSWSDTGVWLATDASRGAVLWSFAEEDGPIGQSGLVLGDREENDVTAVACHPGQEWVAVAYGDGLLVLESLAGDVRRVIGRAGREAVSCLAWHPDGSGLIYGTVSGTCGLLGHPR